MPNKIMIWKQYNNNNNNNNIINIYTFKLIIILYN